MKTDLLQEEKVEPCPVRRMPDRGRAQRPDR